MVDFTDDSMTNVMTEYDAYCGVVSQLIRYTRVCSKYEDCSEYLFWFSNLSS